MDTRKSVLIRNKTIATGLMIGAAILFVVARTQKGIGVWEWVAAFSEAAMVGALADWFAVVALFRHPLGIPIPHTAIIKNKKDAIAGNLADFIRDKFLAPETLLGKLQALNPAERLAEYLMLNRNADELAKGFVRPFRNKYIHSKCGKETIMGDKLSQTYAREPKFYGATYCVGCSAHFPVSEFNWSADNEIVGS